MAFGADLTRFWAMTDKRLAKTIQLGFAEMSEEMQTKALGVSAGGTLTPGNMPYVTMDLVKSYTIMMAGSRYVGEFAHEIAMPNYKLGDKITAFWNQPYAGYAEAGDENFPGWHFVEGNVPKWNGIIQASARRTRNRYKR